MMVSFILCLLPALLATASAQADTLTCNLCSDNTCQPAPGTCPANKATGGCITMAEDITLIGEKSTVLSKGCLDDYNTGLKDTLTVTLGNGKYLRISNTRCNTGNNCNPATLDVPKESTTKNGLQCPTCFAENADTCSSQIAPCTGEEIYCIDFTGEIQKASTPPVKSTFAAKGCATASTQNIKSGDTLNSAVYKFTFTQATSSPAEKAPTTTKPTTTSRASPALGKVSFALYLPGLTGLLLVKLLS